MTGRLRLGVSRSRESYTIPRLLPLFAGKYPGITVEIYTESGQKLLEALRSGRIDLLFLPNEWPEEAEGLCSEYIYSEELILAAKKGALPGKARSTSGKCIKPEALKDIPFFTLRPAHALRIFTENWFRSNHIHPPIGMELSSNISCYRMAAAGMGCCIIPYYAAQLAFPGEEVELFSLGETPQTWDVHMFFRKDQYLGRPEHDMIAIARDVFADEML
jgi:DNA-binding transcriptional LysR family regulator